jgi:hypothetical protein
MKLGAITECQVCQSPDLHSVLFLGYVPPVNTMPVVGKPRDAQSAFPLEMVTCSQCTLAQINYVADPKILFPPDYPYTTGTTRILRENFAQLAEEATGLLNLKIEDLVVDIGSNDGTLLGNFSGKGHPVVGIEPTDKAELANKANVRTWQKFFNQEVADEILEKAGRPKLVTAANVFAHIPDPQGIAKAIRHLVGDDGVFINESHYLLGLVETLQYDTVYHEHLRYYSLRSMIYLLKLAGLTVFRVKRIPTHGGSIRVYSSANPAYQVDPSVAELLAEEDKFGLADPKKLGDFAEQVLASKVQLLQLLHSIRLKKEKVFGIGAPSRASTLLNYCGVEQSLLECVLEVGGSHKIGKYMPGTDIPVENEERLYREQPAYALLLSWHIHDELIQNLVKKGFKGDFIIPLPSPFIKKNPAKP